jgi:VanZ family protein
MMKHAFRVAGAVVVCLIVLLSIIPGNMQIRTGAPKTVEHLAAYLLSGLILMQAFGSYRRAAIVIALLVVLAGALEILQLWVPGRTFALADW